jgi:hypothetical protein
MKKKAKPIWKLTIGMERTGKDNPTMRDISICIDKLDANSSDPFIILECSEKIAGSSFLQMLLGVKPDTGALVYILETRFDDADGYKQYRYKTPDKSEAKSIFHDYFINRTLPSMDAWTDISIELVHQRENSGYIKIQNNADFRKTIRDSIILFKDIVELNGDNGDFYYLQSNDRFYMETVIPKAWHDSGLISSEIYSYETYFHVDTITVHCLDSYKKPLPGAFEPLSHLHKLLPVTLMVFFATFMRDILLYKKVTDYLYNPSPRLFSSVVTSFVKTLGDTSYFVSFNDPSDFKKDEDKPFDTSQFASFISDWNIIKANLDSINHST